MSFPTTPVLDNFNRPDSPTLGANWTQFDSNQFSILSNAAKSGGFACGDYWNPSTFSDSEAYFTFVDQPSAENYLIARLSFPFSGYGLVLNQGVVNSWKLIRIDSGAQTVLGTATQAVVAGDAIGISVIGDTIKAYFKPSGNPWGASPLITATDATYASGFIGVDTLGVVMAFDDFGGGSVVVASVVQRRTINQRVGSR